MPTITVNTDGGGDYTSLSAAIAAEVTDLSVSGRITFNCTGTTVDTEKVVINYYTNASATNNIVITGDASYVLGVSITNGSAAIEVWDEYVELKNLFIKNTNTADPGGNVHGVRQFNGGQNLVCDGVIFEGPNTSHGRAHMSFRGGYGATFKNCLTYKNDDGGFAGYGFFMASGDKAINCTAIGLSAGTGSRGFEGTGAECINCYGGNWGYKGFNNVTQTDCASSDTSATAHPSIAVNSANFTDPANDDYTLAAGSALIGVGVGPSANTDVPDHDFEGDARSGATTDIGYDLRTGAALPVFSGTIQGVNTLVDAAITPLDVSTYFTNPNSALFSANTLPTGLNLNTTTGVISGTPTVVENVNTIISLEGVNSNQFTWTIAATYTPPVFSGPISNVSYVSGAPLSLDVSGYFTNPNSANFTADQLPLGLTISTAGVISGTPTTVGAVNVTITLEAVSSNAFAFEILTGQISKPAVNQPYVESTGVTVRRLTDDGGSRFNRNTYSRRNPENLTGEYFISYHGNTFYQLNRVSTGAWVKQLQLPDNKCEWWWSITNPDELYYIDQPNGYYGSLNVNIYNVQTDVSTLAFTLNGTLGYTGNPSAQSAFMTTGSEGSPSADQTVWAFILYDSVAEDPQAIVVHNRTTGKTVSRAISYNPDHLSVSPSGKYVVCGTTDAGTLRYDTKTLTQEYQLFSTTEHSDIGVGPNGHDWLIYIDFSGAGDGWVTAINLETLEKHKLVRSYSYGTNSWHLSGKAFNKSGYMVFNTGRWGQTTNAGLERKVGIFDLHTGDTRLLLESTRNNIDNSTGQAYQGEVHAVANDDLTRVYFNSNWDEGGGNGAEVYCINVPDNIGSLPLFTNDRVVIPPPIDTLPDPFDPIVITLAVPNQEYTVTTLVTGTTEGEGITATPTDCDISIDGGVTFSALPQTVYAADTIHIKVTAPSSSGTSAASVNVNGSIQRVVVSTYAQLPELTAYIQDRIVFTGTPITAIDVSVFFSNPNNSIFIADQLPTGLSISNAGVVTGTISSAAVGTLDTVIFVDGVPSNSFTWDVREGKPALYSVYQDATAHYARRATEKGTYKYSRVDYARRNPENHDGTYFMVQVAYGTVKEWHIRRVSDGVLYKTLTAAQVSGDCEPIWSITNPSEFFHIKTSNSYVGGLEVYTYNIDTGVNTVAFSLNGVFGLTHSNTGQRAYIGTGEEGSCSADQKRWAFMVYNASEDFVGVAVYDRDLPGVLSSVDVATMGGNTDISPNWVSISPTGEFVVISPIVVSWSQPFFTHKYDAATLTDQGAIHPGTQHGDICLGSDGDDYYVFVDFSGTGDGFVKSVNLQTNVTTPLIRTYDYLAHGVNPSWHFSGKAYNKPGWMVWNTGKSGFPDNSSIFNRIGAINVHNGNLRVAINDTKNNATLYEGEAHATTNKDLSRIYWNSNWYSGGAYDVDVYFVDVPSDPTTMPLLGSDAVVTPATPEASFQGSIPDQVVVIGTPITPVALSAWFSNPNNASYVVSALPAGIHINNNGLISGTPTAVRVVSSTVTLEGVSSNAFSWTINAAPVIASSATLTVVQDTAATLTLTADDAESDPVTFSVSGVWPVWATLSGSVITVQPSQAISAGDYNITVNETDGVTTVSRVITVTVIAAGTLPIGGFAGPLALERVVYGANAVVYKDPDETLDYWVDCSRRLGSDHIQIVNSVTISPTGALTNNGDYLNAYVVSDAAGNPYKSKSVIAVWLSGGTLGETYLININYTTAAGRTYDVDLWVRCMQDVNAI